MSKFKVEINTTELTDSPLFIAAADALLMDLVPDIPAAAAISGMDRPKFERYLYCLFLGALAHKRVEEIEFDATALNQLSPLLSDKPADES